MSCSDGATCLVLDLADLGEVPAQGSSERPCRQVRILADLPQAGAQRCARLLDGRSQGREGVYSPCGIAARQAASNAATHWATRAGSRVSSLPWTTPSPDKKVNTTVSPSKLHRSLPGRSSADARCRGSHRLPPLSLSYRIQQFASQPRPEPAMIGRRVQVAHLQMQGMPAETGYQ